MPVGGGVVEPAGQPAQFGGEHQAHRDRGAVPPLVALAALDRVGQGVSVVEDFAQLRFLLVGRDHLGLDRDGAPDQFGQHRPVGSSAASGSASIRSRITGSAMNPAFTISAMPATISLRGNVSSVARSTSTASG